MSATVSGLVSNGVNFNSFNRLDSDIGTVGLAGGSTYANGTFAVTGAGTTIGGTADSFHFVYQSLSGDGTIIVGVVNLQGGGASHAAGVMIRDADGRSRRGKFGVR